MLVSPSPSDTDHTALPIFLYIFPQLSLHKNILSTVYRTKLSDASSFWVSFFLAKVKKFGEQIALDIARRFEWIILWVSMLL